MAQVGHPKVVWRGNSAGLILGHRGDESDIEWRPEESNRRPAISAAPFCALENLRWNRAGLPASGAGRA
jgi:hypothetical protein